MTVSYSYTVHTLSPNSVSITILNTMMITISKHFLENDIIFKVCVRVSACTHTRAHIHATLSLLIS